MGFSDRGPPPRPAELLLGDCRARPNSPTSQGAVLDQAVSPCTTTTPQPPEEPPDFSGGGFLMLKPTHSPAPTLLSPHGPRPK